MYGELLLSENTITHRVNNEIIWSVSLDKLKLIGEYTTAPGFDFDDYYFVFAETEESMYQVSSFLIDHKTFWPELSAKLNIELAPSLCASTQWATNIIFPEALQGKELFETVENKSGKNTFITKIISFLKNKEEIRLTDEAKMLLK